MSNLDASDADELLSPRFRADSTPGQSPANALTSKNGEMWKQTQQGQDQNKKPEDGKVTEVNNKDVAATSASAAETKPDAKKDGEGKLLVAEAPEKKWRGWWVRFKTTWLMIGGFFMIIAAGHIPVIILVMIIQSQMYREIVALGTSISQDQKLPGFRFLQWLWFVTSMIFSYGIRLIPLLMPDYPMFSRNMYTLSFTMYCAGIVWFVLGLKNRHYKYQFIMFAWCHLSILVVVVQGSFTVANVSQGMFWFVFPATLVVCNDIWAYVFGFFFGRTKLIDLSPKKTWEGFIGATFATFIYAFLVSRLFSHFSIMTCPKSDLSFAHPTCEVDYVWTDIPRELPEFIRTILATVGIRWNTVNVMPIQMHSLGMALFASIVAPFGGFFASGFKRAFKIKDFGDSIPGHGGVTDRMDCQFMMVLFTYVYHTNFVFSKSMHPSTVFTYFTYLDPNEQIDVYDKIQHFMRASSLIK